MNDTRKSTWEVRQRRSEAGAEKRFPVGVSRILVPTDLSSNGSRAMEYAVFLASRLRAELILLHVYEPKNRPDYSLNEIDDTIVDENKERAADALRELCNEIRVIYPRCNMCFRSGMPPEEIVLAAKELPADLIVVSAHNHPWYRHLLDQIKAETFLRWAPCPVLVVQEKEHQDEFPPRGGCVGTRCHELARRAGP